MKYYFLHNQILCFADDISEAIPAAEELTAEQVAFYETNKTATISEVRACKLTEVITIMPTADDQRRQAYAFDSSVSWQEKLLTVDAANSLYLYYRAEGDNERAEAIQALIKTAKAEIREKYK